MFEKIERVVSFFKNDDSKNAGEDAADKLLELANAVSMKSVEAGDAVNAIAEILQDEGVLDDQKLAEIDMRLEVAKQLLWVEETWPQLRTPQVIAETPGKPLTAESTTENNAEDEEAPTTSFKVAAEASIKPSPTGTPPPTRRRPEIKMGAITPVARVPTDVPVDPTDVPMNTGNVLAFQIKPTDLPEAAKTAEHAPQNSDRDYPPFTDEEETSDHEVVQENKPLTDIRPKDPVIPVAAPDSATADSIPRQQLPPVTRATESYWHQAKEFDMPPVTPKSPAAPVIKIDVEEEEDDKPVSEWMHTGAIITAALMFLTFIVIAVIGMVQNGIAEKPSEPNVPAEAGTQAVTAEPTSVKAAPETPLLVSGLDVAKGGKKSVTIANFPTPYSINGHEVVVIEGDLALGAAEGDKRVLLVHKRVLTREELAQDLQLSAKSGTMRRFTLGDGVIAYCAWANLGHNCELKH